jgi:hypothetical protein
MLKYRKPPYFFILNSMLSVFHYLLALAGQIWVWKCKQIYFLRRQQAATADIAVIKAAKDFKCFVFENAAKILG